MPVERDYLVECLAKITKEEQGLVFADLTALDSQFSLGQRLNSPGWRLAREEMAVKGLKRASKRMMDELREIAGTDAPAFADEGGAAVASLADVLTAAHHARQIGGRNPASLEDIEASCRRLAEALNKERQEVIDDLRYRPVPVVGNSQLAGRDININAGGHVSVGGRNAAQHIQGSDTGALLALMSQLQEEIEAAQIADDKRDELLDQLEDIQATARRAKADPSLVKGLATKLWSGVKAVGIPVSTEVAAAYAKMMLGL
jgi:hypothetical protein